MGRLDGRVVLITGAGRGLGHGVARGLAAHGAEVLAVSRTRSELDELSAAVSTAGGAISTHQTDLGRPEEIERLVTTVLDRHGRVDALVNNAAILRMTSFRDLSEAAFAETIAVNLLAPARLVRAFLPGMLDAGRGSIVNVTSAAGIRGFVDETDYCASKFGLEGFSYSLAMELRPLNVSVNLVGPGYRIKPTSVTTAEFALWPPERQAEYRDPIAMADAFAFLAIQDGSGVTGQRFNAFELAERVRTEGWEWHRAEAGVGANTATG